MKLNKRGLYLGGLAGFIILFFGIGILLLQEKKIIPASTKINSPIKQISQIAPVKITTFPANPNKPVIPTATNSAEKSATTSDFTPSYPQNTGPYIPILMYHYIGNNPNPADKERDVLSVTPDKFTSQLDWLAQNGYTPITLDNLYGIYSHKATSPAKPLVLTFDDGYIDFFINAYPILAAHRFHAISFIPTGLIGTSFYMTWDQIKQINTSGLVDFEAHTVNHTNLVGRTYNQILSELVTSKKTLESETGKTVNFLAYPYGASNSTAWKAALDAGFAGGLGTWNGRAGGPGINMPRIRIVGSTSLSDFATKVRP